MSELQTKVINNSDIEFQLKEGSGGAWANLAVLRKNSGSHTIKCRPNSTYREYWMRTEKDKTDQSLILITTDEISEFETIRIVNGGAGRVRQERIRRRKAETEVVNETDHECKIKDVNEDLAVLGRGEKFSIEFDPNDSSIAYWKYSVEVLGNSIPISTKMLTNAEKITVCTAGSRKVKLETISRNLYKMEVNNKSGSAFTVIEKDGAPNPSGKRALLQRDEKYTIIYGPEKKSHKYWVEYSKTPGGPLQKLQLTSSEFAKHRTINIIEGEPPETKVIEGVEPRSLSEKGFWSGIREVVTSWFN